MTGPDDLRRENRSLRERISALNAAILGISASLDLDTVLRETVESDRGLTGARNGVIAGGGEAGAPPGLGLLRLLVPRHCGELGRRWFRVDWPETL